MSTPEERLRFRRAKERVMALNQQQMERLVNNGMVLKMIQAAQRCLRYEENSDVREALNYLSLYLDTKPSESADMKWEEATHGHRYE